MRRIILNVVKLIFVKPLNLVITLSITRFLLSRMSDIEYADYKSALSLILIFFSIDFGIPSRSRNQFIQDKGPNLKLQINQSIAVSFILGILLVFIVVIYSLFFIKNGTSLYYYSIIIFLPLVVAFRNISSYNFIRHKPHYNTLINTFQLTILLTTSYIFIDFLHFYDPKDLVAATLISFGMSGLAAYFIYIYNKNSHIITLKNISRSLIKDRIDLGFQFSQLTYVVYANILFLGLDYYQPIGYATSVVYIEYFMISFMLFMAIVTPLWSELTEDFLRTKYIRSKWWVILGSIVLLGGASLSCQYLLGDKLFFYYSERSWRIGPQEIILSSLFYVFSLIALVGVIQYLNAVSIRWIQVVQQFTGTLLFLGVLWLTSSLVGALITMVIWNILSVVCAIVWLYYMHGRYEESIL